MQKTAMQYETSKQRAVNEMTALVAATDTSAPAVDAVPERILVALDASPHSLAALRAAAKLAATVHAELHGLFIEDDRLLRLCDSPFAREVGLLTAAVRPLDSTAVERKLRVMAGELRYALARAAAEVQVQWSFHVRRGAIERELLQESADALLLSLGRTSWLARRGLGATANALIRQTMRPLLLLGDREELSYPLTLIYTASPSAERALALAIRLTQQAGQPLHVIVVAPSADAAAWQERLSIMLRHNEIPGVFTVLEAEPNESSPTIATRLALIEAIQKRSAILPMEYSSLMAELQGAVLLVP